MTIDSVSTVQQKANYHFSDASVSVILSALVFEQNMNVQKLYNRADPASQQNGVTLCIKDYCASEVETNCLIVMG